MLVLGRIHPRNLFNTEHQNWQCVFRCFSFSKEALSGSIVSFCKETLAKIEGLHQLPTEGIEQG